MTTMVFSFYTYDLWSDGHGGMSVNDVYSQGDIKIKLLPGRDSPTDLQLSRAVGGRGLDWDGESDYTLYATTKRNGNPACELRRVKK